MIRPVFVGGCGRSGTTLLGSMLGSHSQCLATPESKFKFAKSKVHVRHGGPLDVRAELDRIARHPNYGLWGLDGEVLASVAVEAPSYPDALLGLVAAYGRDNGKEHPRVWVDHTPANIVYAPQLSDWFPLASFLHMIRDPRAVVASVLKLDWGPNTVEHAVRWWMEKLAHGLAVETRYGPDRVMRVRYEDLVDDPVGSLRPICDFLDLEFEEQMLQGSGFRILPYTRGQHSLVGTPPARSRRDAWKRELTGRQVEIVESLCGQLLICLGFALENGDFARKPTRREEVAATVREFLMARVNLLRQRRRFRRAIRASGRR